LGPSRDTNVEVHQTRVGSHGHDEPRQTHSAQPRGGSGMKSDEFSAATRRRNLEQMRDGEFDIVVIGGGITGAAIARDAVIRGFKIALVEKGDFASGTSSRSSKMVHGGLRYLKHARFKLVWGALRERWTLKKNIPRLVKPTKFLIPVYRDSKTGKFLLSMGLWLYDILALFRTEKLHNWLGPDDVQTREPTLRKDGLVGAGVYYDFITDDARLVLATVKDAWARGAAVANYAQVVGFEKDRGRIVGTIVKDSISGTQFSMHGKVVVNATGPWSDELRTLDDKSASPRLRPAKGAHLFVPRERIGVTEAVVFDSRRDGRNLFAVPRGDLCLVGTTDVDYHGDLDHVAASKEEVNYLLESLNEYFPSCKITKEDIVSTYASVRPLAAELGVSEDDVSRDQLIFESPSGLVSIIGGKLTTHRSMAKALVDDVSHKLAQRFAVAPARGCETERLALDYDEEKLRTLINGLTEESKLDEDVARHLIESYGSSATQVSEIARESPLLRERIVAGEAYLMAEVRFAARHEMAMTLVDVMFRRTQLAYALRDHGRSVAGKVAEMLAGDLGWSKVTVEKELSGFEQACTLIEARGDA